MDRVISFPHLGDYYIAFEYFLSNVTKQVVLVPPKTTKKTIELGAKYSPDFVCVPFKYNLGNYIEAIEKGANVLISGGGGCRYGYFGELEEKILRDLGYEFEFYNMIEDNHISLRRGYRFCKKMNKKTNIFKCSYYLFNTLLMIIFMDKIDKYIRVNMGFEVCDGSFLELRKEYLKSFKDNGIIKNIYLYFKYKRKFKKIPISKENNRIRVAIIGELYSLIDANASYDTERKLIKMGVEVHRRTDLTYLLITKRFKLHRKIKHGKRYIKYHLGADASLSIVDSYDCARVGFDGIIHLKSFGCIPEISAMNILPIISNEYEIPVLYLSFDAEDNEVGVDTRLEAFYDMIKRKKET